MLFFMIFYDFAINKDTAILSRAAAVPVYNWYCTKELLEEQLQQGSNGHNEKQEVADSSTIALHLKLKFR